jgi:hypothetical protein
VATRYYLDSINRPEGTIWLTLVLEDSANYFVEQFNDSTLSFLTGRVKKIKPADFDGHIVNGTPLAKLVEVKLSEIRAALSSPRGHLDSKLSSSKSGWFKTINGH